MSTKIYDAYRFKTEGLDWGTLWSIQDQARENVKAKIHDYYKQRVLDIHYTDPEFDKKDEGDDCWGRLMYVHDKTRAAVQENAGSLERSEFDVECYICVMPFEGRFYLRAICDHVSSLVGGCLDFLEDHPELEGFEYQNSTGKPDNIPQDEWDERKRVWDGIYSGPAHEARSLRLEISNAVDYWAIANWVEVSRDLHQNPPEIPSLEELAIQEFSRNGGLYDKPVEASIPEPGVILVNDFVIQNKEGEWVVEIRGQKHSHKWLSEIVARVKIACLPEEHRKSFERMLESWAR